MTDLTDAELAELREIVKSPTQFEEEIDKSLSLIPRLLDEVERRRKEEAEIAALAEPPEVTLEKAKARAADRDPLKPK